MPGEPVLRARAFAPCHVTGVVTPATAAGDPRARGSRGAGLVLDLGVRATASWAPADRLRVAVRDAAGERLRISEDVVRRLLVRRTGRYTVVLEHALPIGQGFGTSSAGALATGLAVAALAKASKQDAVEAAHLADLFGGGGLGGVAAILGGGLELRLEPGIPPFGRVKRIPHPDPLVLGTVGPPLPSPRLLGNPKFVARLEQGGALLARFGGRPDVETFWDVAEEFTGLAGLCSPHLEGLLRAMRRRGARAAQAMFGTGFFARLPAPPRDERLLRWLRGRDIPWFSARVPRRGARRLPSPAARGQAF